MKILGHRSITNTIRYTQLVDFKDGESFICKVAKSADDAVKLVESGFEFVSSFPDVIQLYKKENRHFLHARRLVFDEVQF